MTIEEDPNQDPGAPYGDGFDDYYIAEPIEIVYGPVGPAGPDGHLFAGEPGTPMTGDDLGAALNILAGTLAVGSTVLAKQGKLVPAFWTGVGSGVLWILGSAAHFVLTPVDPAATLDLSGPLKLQSTDNPGPKRDDGIVQGNLDGVSVWIRRFDGAMLLQAAQFENAYLGMSAITVTEFNASGGGGVYAQYGINPWTQFMLRSQDNGLVAIESVAFPGRYLRMEADGVASFAVNGAGNVNCQYGVGPFEQFQILPGDDGTIGFRSTSFRRVHLRMDGSKINDAFGAGIPVPLLHGVVNCQYGFGPLEKFKLILV